MAVLQGRLSGVQIDQEAQLTVQMASALFFQNHENQMTNINKEQLFERAQVFLQTESLPTDIQEGFWQEIKRYAQLSLS